MRSIVAVLGASLALAACSQSTTPQPGDVMGACINVCACFSRASDINDCRADCNFVGTGATSGGRLKVGRAFSAGSASYGYSVFWSSGSEAQYTASASCLGCLGTASCETLTKGTACINDCATLVPKGSSF